MVGMAMASPIQKTGAPWNSPHVAAEKNTLYGAYVSPPKTLDPAKAYSTTAMQFIAQILEPPLQYHYLKRPYQLAPLTAKKMPTVTYYDAKNQVLASDGNKKLVAYSVYDIYIKRNTHYQPHAAFGLKKRELIAADYVYQIKRLAHPSLGSPIFGLMKAHIVGLGQYAKTLRAALTLQEKDKLERHFLDLRQHPLEGARVISRYHYQIKIKGVYPQFLFWLTMPFFSPTPWEADAYFSDTVLQDKNITLDTSPIGTGPYMMTENNPSKQIVLEKNPNFRGEAYPSVGEAGDQAKGLLADAGKKMPFIDRYVLSLDKESIPRWNKFMQGYYDSSGIAADTFDQAIQLDDKGLPALTPLLKNKGVRLQTTITPSTFYMGFNMLDEVVGGYGRRARLLRQAISIAVDYEEYIGIFLNGRGVAAQSPLPSGIFGYQAGEAGINPYVYDWVDGKPVRKSMAQAKHLLSEAGYKNGIDPKTGRALLLNYDAAGSGSPDDQATYNWMRKQFAKLGIVLNIRATHYNRFRDKMRTGNAQIFSWGWHADYPDPENFLFLLIGKNGKVKFGGENAANYNNPKVNALFEKISVMENGPARLEKIKTFIGLVQRDSPWLFGYHPISYSLSHKWNRITKPHGIAYNTLKYARLNPEKREERQLAWNEPVLWPLVLLALVIIGLLMPLVIAYWRRERRPNIKRN